MPKYDPFGRLLTCWCGRPDVTSVTYGQPQFTSNSYELLATHNKYCSQTILKAIESFSYDYF
jgi:hypothetical protein